MLDPVTKRQLIAIISSTKFILENKARLNINTTIEWGYASLDKENLVDSIKAIKELTDLEIFNYEKAIEVIHNMKDTDFDKVINIINSVVDSNNVIGFCNELRGTANVEGKMYDTNTQCRILEVPVKIINPSIEELTILMVSLVLTLY